MQAPTAQALQRKRARLRRGVLYAFVVILIGCSFGFVDRLAKRLVPKPDYYKLFFSEMARQTSLETGTPTIVKEDEDTLATFEREYNLRNAKLGFPAGRAYIPDNAVLQFSYIPGMIEKLGPGLIEIPGSKLVKENTRPMIWEDEPGTHPMVIWIYSKRQSLLACFVYQLLTSDHPLMLHPPRPDPRMIQSIDWEGVVNVQGSIPDVRIFPEHAYLLPLGNLNLESLERPVPGLKLENLEQHRAELPNLFVFAHGLPMVTSPGHDETNAPPLPSAGEMIMMLRTQAARPFILTRRVFRFAVLPLGLMWFATSFWRMRRLHQQFSKQMEAVALAGSASRRNAFLAFLTADLNAELSAAECEAHAIQEKMLAAEREKAESKELTAELQRYVLERELPPDEAAQIDRALADQSLSELRLIANRYRRKTERENQIARERQREIQWLESEFEAVPPLKRHNEAREAWELYQDAMSVTDPRLRLHRLKEARKKLPKDLKPETA